MAHDRSWIHKRIKPGGYGFTDEYCDGIKQFLAFAKNNKGTLSNGDLRCPCNTCKNYFIQTPKEVEYHLLATGFLESYTIWHHHGEASGSGSGNEGMNIDHEDVFDQNEMLRDAFGGEDHNNPEEPNLQAHNFYSNLHNLDAPIYPGNVKFTKLTFVMRLLHFKSRHGCSDTGFDELLSLIAEVLPDDHTLPLKYYHIKKMVKKLNLGYDKIHVCENDCMLFYGDDRDDVY